METGKKGKKVPLPFPFLYFSLSLLFLFFFFFFFFQLKIFVLVHFISLSMSGGVKPERLGQRGSWRIRRLIIYREREQGLEILRIFRSRRRELQICRGRKLRLAVEST